MIFLVGRSIKMKKELLIIYSKVCVEGGAIMRVR